MEGQWPEWPEVGTTVITVPFTVIRSTYRKWKVKMFLFPSNQESLELPEGYEPFTQILFANTLYILAKSLELKFEDEKDGD